jgi:hypothetical protein
LSICRVWYLRGPGNSPPWIPRNDFIYVFREKKKQSFKKARAILGHHNHILLERRKMLIYTRDNFAKKENHPEYCFLE